MKRLWKEGKIKPKKPWNKGISTKAAGVSRPVRTMIRGHCLQCCETFSAWKCLKQRFCSRVCAAKWQMIVKNPMQNLQNRRKVKEAKIGLPHLNQRAANHWNWKGGITQSNRLFRHSIEYRLWREKVFKRDNYKCQMPDCNHQEWYLEANHIKKFADYPELRLEVSNGVTLCQPCHNQTKGKEEQFENLFRAIVKSKC